MFQASICNTTEDFCAGNWEQAIEDAQAALQYDPKLITAWYRYGISLITAKLPGEAIEVLETALTLDPK